MFMYLLYYRPENKKKEYRSDEQPWAEEDTWELLAVDSPNYTHSIPAKDLQSVLQPDGSTL